MNEMILPEGFEIMTRRAPETVLAEAKIAAKSLTDVISNKARPVKFNGKQYLEFEDWQTVGRFYGLMVKTSEPEFTDINGAIGAKAKAEVMDAAGRVVGGATAWCLRDEPSWEKKPWYQLGSMAQTRAGSKALRNILSWVVVLAGYAPTPAEELPQGEDTKQEFKPQENEPTIVSQIMDGINVIAKGDPKEAELYLKTITIYTSKDGTEKWLRPQDLENVAKHKPQWITRIHKKVAESVARIKA